MRYKKFLFLTVIMAFIFCFEGCAGNGIHIEPDYSASDKQFDFYSYEPPTDGNYTEYDVQMNTGEDYRTVERYQEYLDSGNNILMLFAPEYTGNWERSNTKRIYDIAVEAGVERIIIRDTRLAWLSAGLTIDGNIYKKERLVGVGEKFETEADLDAYVESCLADYRGYKNLYGIMLQDEPTYAKFGFFGDMYRSIRRVAPELFIQTNILPMISNLSSGYWGKLDNTEGMNDDEIREATYKRYLNAYLDATGADYFQVDQYPMNKNSIYPTYMRCLQICAETAKERGVQLYFVTQTCNILSNGTDEQRTLSEAECRWLNNMLVGYGVKCISYFGYWRRSGNSRAEFFIDNASFISQYGKKTDIYYYMQQIMKEEQSLAPTVLNFEYNASAIYKKTPATYTTSHIARVENGRMTEIKNVSVNKEIALITELVDKSKNNYMYMIQNIIDPMYKGSTVYQTVTVTFSDEYEYAVVWEKGVKSIVKLEDHKYTVKQHPGYAVYVIPY